jgi:glycine cleavage system H lipoate-binding protein
VGIDEFAFRLLGPFDRIEAPLVGKEVQQGRADIDVVRGEQKAGLISPVSGVVTAVNAKIREEGNAAGQEPYSEGWVISIHSKTLRQDLKNLMIHTESAEFMEGEVARLYQVIEETAGPLAADGGHLGDNIYGHMPELGWEKLVKIFLKTWKTSAEAILNSWVGGLFFSQEHEEKAVNRLNGLTGPAKTDISQTCGKSQPAKTTIPN